MGDLFKILPILMPPARLTKEDRKEFRAAQQVLDLWDEKFTQYFKSPTAHNLRIKTLVLQSNRAAQKKIDEARDSGIWPVQQRPPSPHPAIVEKKVEPKPAPKVVRPPVAIDPMPGYSGSHLPVANAENAGERERRMERRKARVLEYERRMADREAQEDREEKERERAREALRMSEIRAEQMKTMVFARSRLLRPDKDGFRLKWERKAVKC